MAEITVTTEGLDAVKLRLSGISARTADMTPAMADIYESFLKVEEKRFANEGPGWAPLKTLTLDEKARKGYPSTILEATGALRKSLTIGSSPGAVFEPSPFSVTMGSDLMPASGGTRALAEFHQKGTVNMPARPVIDTVPEHTLEWAAIIGEYIIEGAAAGAVTSLSIDLGPGGL